MKIDYRPNLIVKSLRKSRNFRISVLIPDPRVDPYWAEANAGIILARCEWENYGVTIVSYFYVHEGDLFLEPISSQALKSKPDGMVIAPIFTLRLAIISISCKRQGYPMFYSM